MDRIKHINDLISKDFVTTRKQSTILNNIYSLITIVIITIAIIIYTNFILEKKEKVVELTPHQKYLEERKKQIELSHKLNNIKLEPNYE
ncbi:MAG: hypothetical protein U9Q30_08660 [Campylobacterota bacterium]|nr:hypothetical protein [Campylobacterota bacterium]